MVLAATDLIIVFRLVKALPGSGGGKLASVVDGCAFIGLVGVVSFVDKEENIVEEVCDCKLNFIGFAADKNMTLVERTMHSGTLFMATLFVALPLLCLTLH